MSETFIGLAVGPLRGQAAHRGVEAIRTTRLDVSPPLNRADLHALADRHAETHAIILPHVTRFNLVAAEEARTRLAAALGGDGADRLAQMLRGFPVPQRLVEVGFDCAKTDFVAQEIAAMAITVPRKVSPDDVRTLLAAAG